MGKIHLLKQTIGGKYTAITSDDIDSTLQTMNETLSDKLELILSSKEFTNVNNILLMFTEKLEQYKVDDDLYEFTEDAISEININFLKYNEVQ